LGRPQQGRAIVLASLRVGAEGARVVVPHHHDEPWPSPLSFALVLLGPSGMRPSVLAANRSDGDQCEQIQK
jgi:hypothetical protein